ncbi:MAG: CHAT domain-containing protein [Anaerolineae bacterium]|nr:CHAT domain-containing protein [Anaerolineae bacterium]
MEYLSFDLRLGEFDPASCTLVAEVLHSPVGESERYRVQMSPDLLTSGGRLDRTPDSVIMLGKRLLRSVFTRDSLMLWYESCQVARERNRGLRLRLHIDSLELIKLPWELMYDPQKGEFLVFDPMVSLVRYLRLHAPPPPLRERGSIKILVVVAVPEDQPPLDWRRELTMLADALEELIDLGKVQVIPCLHATHEALHMALLEHSPDVVHFVGHAHYDHAHKRGWISLESKQHTTAPIEAHEMARMFRRYGGNLVVLNACDTANGDWAGLAPALVRAEVPAVVAMQWPVEDHAAVRFARSFYRALAMGRTVDECVAEGRIGASAASADPNDWAAPVLFLRSNSGRLWREDVTQAYDESEAAQVSRTMRGGPPTPERSRDEGFLFPTRGPLLPEDEGRLLIDRPELRRVRRLALQPTVSQYIALLSARQTGKTTIILSLWRDLAGRYDCVFVDLSVLRAQDTPGCFQFLAFHLANALSERMEAAEIPSAQKVTDGVSFIRFLRELAGKLDVPRIVVLLDEVGALRPTASDAVFNALRAVFTQGRGGDAALARYLFVFSGAVDLYALTAGANSPLNICEKVYLRDFGRPEVGRLLCEFERLDVDVPDTAVDQVYALTNGHPYLTMRICALLERANVSELSARNIEAAAEEMLVDDDNIHHVIHQLDQSPAERARLRSILIDGRELPFTRNDPVLASLEMIGAIQPSQPCRVRNQLYERALRPYLAAHGADLPTASQPLARSSGDDPDAAFVGVETLRARALDRRGTLRGGQRWEAYAAALFSLVPCLTLYPDARARQGQMGVLFAIADKARDALWRAYRPGLLVQRADLAAQHANEVLVEAVNRANELGLCLAVVLTAGPGVPSPKHRAALSGVYDGVTVLVLDDIALAPILETHGDLDGYLLHRIASARHNASRLIQP